MRGFTNPLPVYANGEKVVIPLPDPYVIKYNGIYYCYATGKKGIPVLSSVDLTQWNYCGYALENDNEHEFWAPCAINSNGIFYLYYSSRDVGEEDCHKEYLKVAKSLSPKGPFEYIKTLYNKFSIDPHVVPSIQGGFDLYYSVNDFCGCDSRRPGTAIVCEHMTDEVTLCNYPEPVVLPSADNEIFCRNRFGDGRDWHTVEGAFHHRVGGNEYLMYSGNAYTDEDYFVGYAMKSLNNTWEKQIDTCSDSRLLKRNDEIEGVGHNSIIKAPNKVDEWIVYHGREVLKDSEENERRTMRIDPLHRDGDKLWTDGPTKQRTVKPACPKVRAFYEGDSKDSKGLWNIISGTWVYGDDSSINTDADAQSKMLSMEVFESCIFEVNFCSKSGHMGCIAGVVISYLDDGNYSEILFNTGNRRCYLKECVNGIAIETQLAALKTETDFSRYHQLIIEKTKTFLSIYLNNSFLAECNIFFQNGRMGLSGYYSAVAFAGISITNTFFINEKNKSAAISMLESKSTGAWYMKDDARICCDTDTPAELTINGCNYENFKIELDYKLMRSRADSSLNLAVKSADNTFQLIVHLKDNKFVYYCNVNGETIQLFSENYHNRFSTVVLECIENEITVINVCGQKTFVYDYLGGYISISGVGALALKNLRITELNF